MWSNISVAIRLPPSMSHSCSVVKFAACCHVGCDEENIMYSNFEELANTIGSGNSSGFICGEWHSIGTGCPIKGFSVGVLLIGHRC